MCESENVIELPEPRYTSDVSIEQALSERRSCRSFADEPLTVPDVSQLLWAAQGITNERGYRTAPSGGALFPLETYVVVGNVVGLKNGIYRYKPREHSLAPVLMGDKRGELCDSALGQAFLREVPVSIVFSAIYERITEKYGERGKQYTHMEAGHAAQNVYLQAISLDLGTVVVGAFRDNDVKKIIPMEENEQPLYIMPVGKKRQ
ncbi:SagB/ThcOx family dehydrogenase [Candidatus Latescibacterota bacterium]